MTDESSRYARRLKKRMPVDSRPVRAVQFRIVRDLKGEKPEGDYFNPAGGVDWEHIPTMAIPPEVAFAERIPLGAARKVLAKYNFCIYCGAPEYDPGSKEPPHDEHIIPEGLGGNLVIENASCRACANRINSFEGNLQRNLFHSARQQLGIRGKKSHSKHPLTVLSLDDDEEKIITLTPDMHPSILLMPKFRLPAYIEYRPDSHHFIYNIWFFTFDDRKAYLASPVNEYLTPELDYMKFSQLLAKIAFCYLATVSPITHYSLNRVPIIGDAEMDCAKFTLKRLGKEEVDFSCFAYIGSAPPAFERSEYLHEIGLGKLVMRAATFDMVYIRLFANLGAPLYMIVVDRRYT